MDPSWQDLKKQLNEALVSAFNQPRFERMLRLECDQDLNHLAATESTYPHKVFLVIEDAESNGWLDCLARGAHGTNPGNDALQVVTAAILAGIDAEGNLFYQVTVDDSFDGQSPEQEEPENGCKINIGELRLGGCLVRDLIIFFSLIFIVSGIGSLLYMQAPGSNPEPTAAAISEAMETSISTIADNRTPSPSDTPPPAPSVTFVIPSPTPTVTPSATPTPTLTPSPTATMSPSNTPTPATIPTSIGTAMPTTASTKPPAPPACPPAKAEGTEPPAITISAITFTVDGINRTISSQGGGLQAPPGVQVTVREVTICTDPFAGTNERVGVEFHPVGGEGNVIEGEIKGTLEQSVTARQMTVPGPDYTWTVGDGWRHFSVVTVHYPSDGNSGNPTCAGGTCEVDDRLIVSFQ